MQKYLDSWVLKTPLVLVCWQLWHPSNPANWVKFGASTGMLFMKANPFTFVVGVGYTVLDQGGYIDDWIGNKP